jgi:hypothetical protein
VRPSFENAIDSIERSQPSVSARRVPVFRSCTTTWNRSASNPGRFIERHASIEPSGEYTGCVSHAGLSAVRLCGSSPSTLTSYRSKLVDHGSL